MTAPATYGLFGYPVHHSWSPFIHGMFARQTGAGHGVPAARIAAGASSGSDVLEFFAEGGQGINVTLPHKQAAADLVNELTPRAELADAVNTIAPPRRPPGRRQHRRRGTAAATWSATCSLKFDAPRILLLGAGGAARGVLGPLLGLQPELLVIANRTAERARDLAAEFARLGPVSARASSRRSTRAARST